MKKQLKQKTEGIPRHLDIWMHQPVTIKQLSNRVAHIIKINLSISYLNSWKLLQPTINKSNIVKLAKEHHVVIVGKIEFIVE